MISDSVFQELHRRGVAERRLAPTPVVVIEQLGQSVVPAVTPALYRASALLRPRLKDVAGILVASSRLMGQVRACLAAAQHHRKRNDHDARCGSRLNRSADDLAIGDFQQHREIQPAFVSPDIGKIGPPGQLLGCWREATIKRLQCRLQGSVPRVRYRLVAPLVPVPRVIFDASRARREVPVVLSTSISRFSGIFSMPSRESPVSSGLITFAPKFRLPTSSGSPNCAAAGPSRPNSHAAAAIAMSPRAGFTADIFSSGVAFPVRYFPRHASCQLSELCGAQSTRCANSASQSIKTTVTVYNRSVFCRDIKSLDRSD